MGGGQFGAEAFLFSKQRPEMWQLNLRICPGVEVGGVPDKSVQSVVAHHLISGTGINLGSQGKALLPFSAVHSCL